MFEADNASWPRNCEPSSMIHAYTHRVYPTTIQTNYTPSANFTNASPSTIIFIHSSIALAPTPS